MRERERERERGGGGSLLCGMAVSAIAGKRVVLRVAVCCLAFECYTNSREVMSHDLFTNFRKGHCSADNLATLTRLFVKSGVP